MVTLVMAERFATLGCPEESQVEIPVVVANFQVDAKTPFRPGQETS